MFCVLTGNFRADQPERQILRDPFGVVDILIACDAAVDGLPE